MHYTCGVYISVMAYPCITLNVEAKLWIRLGVFAIIGVINDLGR